MLHFAAAPRSLWILGEARIPKRETRRDIHAHGGNKRGESSMAGAGGGGSSGGSGYGGSGGGGGGGGAGGGGEAAGLAAIWAAYLKLCETKPVRRASESAAKV